MTEPLLFFRVLCWLGLHDWLGWEHTGVVNVRECLWCQRRERLSDVVFEDERPRWEVSSD